MRAATAVVELLRSEGVDRVFGNAGTTELPLLAEVAGAPDLSYVLGLQEASVVAMADGYARATRRPAFVNLHVAAGLANGLANILNALRSHVPLVVSAGQQDLRHLDQDPFLAADLVTLASPVCKTAVEVRCAADVPMVLRRAFRDAAVAPAGPVFVSLPMNLLQEEVGSELPARSALPVPGPAGGIESAAATLRAAAAPALVIGDGVAREDAVEEAVALAEALGAAVYQQPFADGVGFPPRHPLFRGALEPVNATIARALSDHDVVLIVGTHAFAAHYYTPSAAVPPNVTLLQLDSDAAEVGRNYPVAHALVGGLRPSLQALTLAVSGDELPAQAHRGAGQTRVTASAGVAPNGGCLDVRAAAAVLAAALPERAVVVEEAVTSAAALRHALAPDRPGTYHRSAGGGLGWGVGAAVGFALGSPGDPIVAVLGDGAAMYGIQGLWSAAHEQVDVTFVVLNNRRYNALRVGLSRLGLDIDPDTVPGVDLSAPVIDWLMLARSLGVAAVRVDGKDDLHMAVAETVTGAGPRLIDVPLME